MTLWPWPLTYDLEKLIRSGHYHYQCVYQIWEQSIPWFFSYRVNTIAGGGRRVAGGGRHRRKTITSPDPSDTGDIITFTTYCLTQRISKLPGSFEIHWVRQYLVNFTALVGIVMQLFTRPSQFSQFSGTADCPYFQHCTKISNKEEKDFTRYFQLMIIMWN